MTPDHDYYDVLGVSPKGSQDEIKRAYRRLAKQYHPDRNKAPEAEERLKEINLAYEVLSHPEKRAAYDRSRKIRACPVRPRPVVVPVHEARVHVSPEMRVAVDAFMHKQYAWAFAGIGLYLAKAWLQSRSQHR